MIELLRIWIRRETVPHAS